MPDGKIISVSEVKKEIESKFEELGNKGFRILGICYRDRGLMQMDNSKHDDNNDKTMVGLHTLQRLPNCRSN
jgi:magnesium-transporting ATPase (P-type)